MSCNARLDINRIRPNLTATESAPWLAGIGALRGGLELSCIVTAMATLNVIANVPLDLTRTILGRTEKFEYTTEQIVTAILYAFLICLLFGSGGIPR